MWPAPALSALWLERVLARAARTSTAAPAAAAFPFWLEALIGPSIPRAAGLALLGAMWKPARDRSSRWEFGLCGRLGVVGQDDRNHTKAVVDSRARRSHHVGDSSGRQRVTRAPDVRA
jgi:hypothetical protein